MRGSFRTCYYFNVTRKVRKLRKSVAQTGKKSLPLARVAYQGGAKCN